MTECLTVVPIEKPQFRSRSALCGQDRPADERFQLLNLGSTASRSPVEPDDYCLENTDETAVTLSTLLDEGLPIEQRLDQFYAFTHPIHDRGENSRSPGSLLRAVTTLLMYAHPDRHIAFQYQRIDEFFQEYTDVEHIETGYNPSQYKEVVLACRRLRDELEQRTNDASMIDVQTLIYVAHDA